MPNSILMSWLHIITVCMRVSSSFSFFANSLMSSMYIRWLIFPCNLLSLDPAVHFLSMWLSSIMVIMNSKGDSLISLENPCLDLSFSKTSFSCCQLPSPGLHGLFDEVSNFMWYFVHFETVHYPALSCPVSWDCRIHWLHLCRGVRPPLTSVLDMTLNNLMVRFQQCWSFGECGVPLHCHRSQVHSGPEL